MSDKRQPFENRFEERKEFLSQLAMNAATACPCRIFSATKVFYIGEGWHTDWLRNREEIYKPQSIKYFEEALLSNEIKVIFLREENFVPIQAMSFYCMKANGEKIVFVEGDIDD